MFVILVKRLARVHFFIEDLLFELKLLLLFSLL